MCCLMQGNTKSSSMCGFGEHRRPLVGRGNRWIALKSPPSSAEAGTMGRPQVARVYTKAFKPAPGSTLWGLQFVLVLGARKKLSIAAFTPARVQSGAFVSKHEPPCRGRRGLLKDSMDRAGD